MSSDLHKALSTATTEEEKKAVMKEYEDEVKKLTDEELFLVAGGTLFEESLGGWPRKN